MWYLSDIIDDLAFVFLYIEESIKRYEQYNLCIHYEILLVDKGFKVAVTPYEPIYSRTKQD
jgi:hypothetical protein